MRNGRRFHQCYCGSAGFIEGSIETLEADQHTFTVEPTSSVENREEGGEPPELLGTSSKHSLSGNADRTSEAPKLPLSSPPLARKGR